MCDVTTRNQPNPFRSGVWDVSTVLTESHYILYVSHWEKFK